MRAAGLAPNVPSGTLLAFRLRHGRLSVAALDHEPAAASPEVDRLRQVLRRHLQPHDRLDQWHAGHTLGRLVLRALAEVPDLLADPLPPLDEILPLGARGWPRDQPVDGADGGVEERQLVLSAVPANLIVALQRDAGRLGISTSDLAVLLLSAVTYRGGVSCRHDAETAWIGDSLEDSRTGRCPDPIDLSALPRHPGLPVTSVAPGP